MRRLQASLQGRPEVEVVRRIIEEAQEIKREDIAICRAIGRNGAALVPDQWLLEMNAALDHPELGPDHWRTRYLEYLTARLGHGRGWREGAA